MGPGDVLAGRFELRRRIGAGGLAEVFAAHDRVSRGDVAIKILHAHLAEDRDLAERFRREMAVTRALDHPGIVRVFDLHEHEGRPLFSMELLQGRTLYEVLLQEGPMAPEEARRIAREICAALQAAHRAGVVHRDLKPQNVFVTSSRAVKLLDFGLARVAGQTRLTSKTAILGTPGYIAPELFAGQRADGRADLYALGATYFEMLAGKRPFASSDPYDVTRLQREAPQLDARIREEDAAILRRALDPDPEQRFLDASQMLRALTGESVPKPPATPPPMTAGEYDVLVHNVVRPQELVQARPPIVRVLDRLGAEATPQWRWRLLGAGQAVLVSAASRRTAEAAAAVCAEHGLPATVRPVSLRPRSEEFLSRYGGWLLAAVCTIAAWLVALVFDANPLWIPAGAAAGYVLSWGLRPPPSKAPLVGLPGQDSSMARLADGIARRAERLRRGKDELPESHRQAVDELVRAAGDATGLARKATAETAPDSGPALHQMDLLTSRLLEIATALDDALAAAEVREGTESVVLRRLKQDAEVAQQALRLEKE
ncbi:MAG: serine/threonine protein kinase [Myxococcales bacterium]|nr:serine/threonine protein kinase [Myxococcales bacterium]